MKIPIRPLILGSALLALSEAFLLAAPPVLRSVVATAHDPSCAMITWQEVGGAVEYRIYRRPAQGSYILVGKVMA